ncbi:type IV toxin-antitoxin system AbiEi family antitoxin [Paraburkholderia sp. J63]|uniref:type IV toxin-antitoxin system AbiEi family antitoxin n=1 Tax=Paraburkholderia sp. J63 TaxID=2805434 RepID=UPI002ABDB0CC|nr:type IV toxin-antitoxin system AbiEi family antitoxin [Paraburkholderia sp. J63]
MNDANQHDLPSFDHPTEALVRQLVNAASGRLNLPLRVVDFRTAGRSVAAARDVKVTLEVNGASQPYTLVARGRIRSREDVRAVVAKNATANLPILLATPCLTLALADECVEQGLQFIDLAGNLYVHASGQYMLVTGRPANPDLRRLASRSGKPAFSASASALRMIFVLLSAPELINRPYREIVSSAGVALGTVGSVFDDLRERGLLAGTADRRLLDPAALREEWAINYSLRLLPKLNVQRFVVDDPSWWQHAELPAGQAWWSGEVAAAKLTGQLRPASQTLYVEPAARPSVMMALAKRHRLRGDPAGSLEIIDAFWHLDDTRMEQLMAPPLLVYADLQRTREPRNAEAAALILDQLEQGE